MKALLDITRELSKECAYPKTWLWAVCLSSLALFVLLIAANWP